jgi:hypothetical protein
MKVEYSPQNFEKSLNIKFHANLSSGGRAVPRWRTDGRRDRHDEAFRNFANAPKHTGSTAIKMDSKVLCKAKYASVTTKGVGQFYNC